MLLEGWSTADRRLLLHLVVAINRIEAIDRVDRVPLEPEIRLARAEMLAFLKQGGTGGTGNRALGEQSGTQTPVPMPKFVMLSVEATSSELGCSESYTRRMCRKGPLAAIKVNGAWQVERQSVEMRRRQMGREL